MCIHGFVYFDQNTKEGGHKLQDWAAQKTHVLACGNSTSESILEASNTDLSSRV